MFGWNALKINVLNRTRYESTDITVDLDDGGRSVIISSYAGDMGVLLRLSHNDALQVARAINRAVGFARN